MVKDMLNKLNKKSFNIIRSCLVFLLFWYGSYYLKFIPILLFKLDIKSLSPIWEIILALFASAVLAIIFYLVYRKDLKKEFKKFKTNFLENMNIGLKYWMAGLCIMMVSNLILTFVFKSGGANNENAVQEMLKISPLLMFISAGILAPFNEEIVFRKTIKDIIDNKWLFVILAFLFFGGAHVIGGATAILDYLYIIPYGALGGAFAMAYYETDTVFTSMTFHMIHNTILIIFSILL